MHNQSHGSPAGPTSRSRYQFVYLLPLFFHTAQQSAVVYQCFFIVDNVFPVESGLHPHMGIHQNIQTL